jgi:hypothetical protein
MTPDQKQEILRAVESSSLPVKESLIRLDVSSSTYYRWKANFDKHGREGLHNRSPFKGRTWNEILPHEEKRILEVADLYPDRFSREISVHISDNDNFSVSESTVYRFKGTYSRTSEQPEIRVVFDSQGKISGLWLKPWRDEIQ